MHVYRHVPFKYGGRITTGYSTKHNAKDITPRNDDDGQVFAVGDGTVTDTESNMSQETTTPTASSCADRINS